MAQTAQADTSFPETANFSRYLLGVIATLACIASLVEVDRRGILLHDDAEAFALSEIEGAALHSYPLVWGERPGRGGRDGERGPRRALRLIEDAGTPASQTGAPAGPQNAPLAGNGQPVQLAAASPQGAPGAVPGTQTSFLSPPAAGAGPIGFVPGGGSSSSGGSSGGGGDNGVVPAVPEPASWLLMILGIGALGIALRRQQTQGAGMAPAAA